MQSSDVIGLANNEGRTYRKAQMSQLLLVNCVLGIIIYYSRYALRRKKNNRELCHDLSRAYMYSKK